MTGVAAWGFEANELAAGDLRRGELIGIPAALVILVIVFGAIVAAVVPAGLAGAAVAIAAPPRRSWAPPSHSPSSL